MMNLILGLTGSVASIKLDELVEKLLAAFGDELRICIVPTSNALHFVPDLRVKYDAGGLTERLAFLSGDQSNRRVVYFLDEDEWSSWSKRNDPVLHIELRKWAHMMLIAPLDANTLAKIANGLCDNLLTSVARAWDMKLAKNNQKPVIVCPAMNTCMYEHPLTKIQLDLICNQFGFILVDSISKKLMCNDVGIGAMASTDSIVQTCLDIYKT